MTLASCGTDSRHFKIDGRLLNVNQGEFYVYSPDGALPGLDTVKVQAGRFTKEIACDRPMTLMLVFPNFTEQPIFAQPGKTVDVKGDAYHLKRAYCGGYEGQQTHEFLPPTDSQRLATGGSEVCPSVHPRTTRSRPSASGWCAPLP